jgi:hypothetical protein
MDIGGAEAWQRLTFPVEVTVHVARANILKCFYQCSFPCWLGDYFSLIKVSASFALDLGICVDVHGAPLLRGQPCHSYLCVLPMGFSWTFWFVQKVHEL